MSTAGWLRPPPLYRLYAVVCHLGQMEGGHYIAYLRQALRRPCVAGLQSCLQVNRAAKQNN